MDITKFPLVFCLYLLNGLVRKVVLSLQTETCNLTRYEHCVEPLRPYLLDPSEFPLFPVYDDESLNAICSRYPAMKQCFSPLQSQCDRNYARVADGIIKATEFICSSNVLKKYREQRYCYSKSDVITAAARCNVSYNIRVARLVNSTLHITEKKKALCSLMNELLQCIYSTTEEICGKGAAVWIFETKTIMMTPAMEEIGCNSEIISLDASFIFGIIMGLVFAIIVLVVFLLCYRNRRSKAFQAKASRDSRRSGGLKTSFIKDSATSTHQINKVLLKQTLDNKDDVIIVADQSTAKLKMTESEAQSTRDKNNLLISDL